MMKNTTYASLRGFCGLWIHFLCQFRPNLAIVGPTTTVENIALYNIGIKCIQNLWNRFLIISILYLLLWDRRKEQKQKFKKRNIRCTHYSLNITPSKIPLPYRLRLSLLRRKMHHHSKIAIMKTYFLHSVEKNGGKWLCWGFLIVLAKHQSGMTSFTWRWIFSDEPS